MDDLPGSAVSGTGERGRSFGAVAGLYDKRRPGYPTAAVDAVLPAGARRVAEVGAGEVDAVLYAQAWHSVDADAAAREAVRVLVPGGVLAMLWNMHDDRVGWVEQLNRLADNLPAITDFPDPPALTGFRAGRRYDVAWRQPLRRSELLELVVTWSPVSTQPLPARQQILDRVWGLIETPELAGADLLELPYVCSTRAYHRTPAS